MPSSRADLALPSAAGASGPLDAARQAPSISKGLVFLLATTVALGPLAIDVYLPAFTEIAKTFGVEMGAVQLTLSVFLAGTAVGQAFYGPITDRWGRRRPLLFGLAVFVLASIGCALAPTVESLTVARGCMALGGAAGMVVSRAVVRDRCEVHEMVQVFSLLMLIMGAAPIFAPSLGGLLLTVVGWRGIFWALAACGAACLFATARWLPESLPASRRSRGGVVHVLQTYRSLILDPWFAVHSLIAGATSFALFGYVSSAPTVFLGQHGVTPQTFSILFGCNAACLIGAAQLNRLFLRRWSLRRVLVGGSTLHLLAALLLLAVVLSQSDGLLVTELGVAFSLASMGIVMPNVGALVLAPFAHLAGSASALQGSLQFGLGALAGTAVGLLDDGTALPLALVLTCGSAVACGLSWSSTRWGEHLP